MLCRLRDQNMPLGTTSVLGTRRPVLRKDNITRAVATFLIHGEIESGVGVFGESVHPPVLGYLENRLQNPPRGRPSLAIRYRDGPGTSLEGLP